MSSPRLSIIVAVARNNVIGKGQELAWHIKDDLRRFRLMTEGRTVIVGRATFEQLCDAYESRGRTLPDRNHIVVTHNETYQAGRAKCYVCHSIDEAISKAKELEREEIFIAGGAQIFKQTIELVERIYLTDVELEIEGGDAFFPSYEEFNKVISSEKRDENGINFRYLTLERV